MSLELQQRRRRQERDVLPMMAVTKQGQARQARRSNETTVERAGAKTRVLRVISRRFGQD